MTPITVTGFNADLVIESTASGPPFSSYATELNPGENLSFYESGLSGFFYGLPAGGNFTSADDGTTVFQFQPFTGNNALVMSSDTGITTGTLTLATPQTYGRVAILANSASGGGYPNVTFNFNDGTSYTTFYNAPDWFNNSGYALLGVERINLGTGNTSGAPDNPRFYQTTIDLDAALGLTNKTLVSISVDQAAGAGSTAIYAVSGAVGQQIPAAILGDPKDLTVNEADPASFNAAVSGNPTPAVQWYRGAVSIPGATNVTYNIAAAALTNSGALYRLVASNVANSVTYVVTSGVARLTVIADTNPPVLLQAQSLGLTTVEVDFSEKLAPASATNIANYAITGTNGSPGISSASLDGTQKTVLLTVSAMTDGATYTLTVTNVTDQAAAANPVAANSHTNFVATVYMPANVGGAALPGSQTAAGNWFNLSGSGTDLGGTSDQFQYSYVLQTGDFDVMVRLDSLTPVGAWTEAGMVVHEGLNPGAREVSVMATPGTIGCYFQSRTVAGGATTLSGSFPANYPNTWLRLKRSGNTFTGWAGFDGKNWTQLGSVTAPLAGSLYFGFAVSSHDNTQLATAAFRDFATVTNATESGPLDYDPLAQCSRNTPLVISEIMYHPTNSGMEYVELYNSSGEPQDISGFQLDGSVHYTFPTNTVMPGGGFVVVAESPAAVQAAYGLTGVFGPYTNNLPNSSGKVILRHRSGALFLEVGYSDQPPWPAAADGAGPSLVLAHPSYGQNNPKAWAASDVMGGSPGRLEPISMEPLRGVVINEFLAHTDPPLEDYIELYNHSNVAKDLSGAWLSDTAGSLLYRIPDGTTIAPRGFAVFTQTTLGFSLSAAGEQIFLVNSNRSRVIDSYVFGAQENGVSFGRVPDGAPDWYRLAARTPGTNNGVAMPAPVVINELMYHPVTELDDDQYVELYNRTASAVDLSGWQLTDGITFTFPGGTVIPAHGYLVAARNAAHLRANYSNLTAANCLGDFGGRLSHSGERVALAKPDYNFVTNNFQVITNTDYIVVNEVTYSDGGRWPQWADGGGSSLELTDPNADTRLAANWADSDETAKAPWTTVSRLGTVDNLSTTADELQVLQLGAGECLVDDVEVRDASDANRISNSSFESNASGWTAEGTEENSGWEAGSGYNSAHSYHVRAVARGDNQVNRVRTLLTSSLSYGSTATIKARVRWLRGSPQILFRLRGNGLEAAATMTLPTNLGTPGAANSRAVNNAPPAIYDVAHAPVLPAASQPVVVTARANDPQGVTALMLNYRLDPDTSYTAVTMKDDGTGGDAVAGDGVYSATIPGQATGVMVAYYIQATDGFAPAASALFPNDAPVRECLIHFGETIPTGNLPVYLIWMTQSTFNTWTARNRMNNLPNDVTFVVGNQRAIYNTQAHYAGSPYISPGYSTPAGNRCGYTIGFPADDVFLGDTELVIDWPGGHGGENTGVQEQMAYWIADRMGLAYSYRHYIRLQVNGVTDMQRGGVFEAVLQPSSEYVDIWSPDATEGQFFKIERAFECSDGGSLSADPEPQLQLFTTIDPASGNIIKKMERYRWNWLLRGSGNAAYDFTNLFALVDAVNATDPEPYTTQTEGIADMEEWMRTFAFEHIVVNFDSWGHAIGKNMYGYKPVNGKWQIYPFDLDWLMLVSARASGSYAANTADLFTCQDPTVSRMYYFPPFRRAYFRAVQAAVDGPLRNTQADPVMDAKYRSLVDNGVTMCDGQTLVSPSAVKQWFSDRRTFLLDQLAGVAANFSVNGPVTFTLNTNLATISGSAPVSVTSITINGQNWPVTWTTVTNWTLNLPLATGTNLFAVTAYDGSGAVVGTASNLVTVKYTGTVPDPAGSVVINEIMYDPVLPGAQYVELFNNSSNTVFDLSGWRINGLSYTFPAGSYIAPGGYLVLTQDRSQFDIVYGPDLLAFDQYAGNLQNNGEVLTLFRPGALPDQEIVVDRVRYEAASPWPAPALGASLQLVDAGQDNSRVADWVTASAASAPPSALSLMALTNTWKYMQVSNLDGINWTATNFNDTAWPAGAGLLAYEVNSQIVPLINTYLNPPGEAINDVQAGHADYFRTTINLPNNLSGYTITANAYIDDGAVFYVNGVEVARVRMAAGVVTNRTFATGLPPSGDAVTPDQFTLPASLFVPGTNYVAVEVHQNVAGSSDVTFGLQLDAAYTGGVTAEATPGAANSVVATQPAFPTVWLNELQADNVNGATDNFGQHEPWVELYNPGTNAVSLAGCHLSASYTNLGQWAFPATASVPAGGFLLVWCDNETNQSTASVFHAGFRLASGAGQVALSRTVSGTNQVLDYLTYNELPSNWTYGDVPDGQPFYRANLFYPTPGVTNNAASAPIVVYINEWMADNAATLADPTDNKFQDWFEIYNPGTNTVDLGGYYLTDDLTTPLKNQIPSNGHYTVPPGGYLLVWADGEASQNSTNVADLHVNFSLSKGGEAIGLFAADGTQIDAVVFGAQSTDISQGRFPDGGANLYFMNTPTPRLANVLPNTAPVLSPITNREVMLGQTVTFTAQASDADHPAQILTFSLGAGAPAGAAINPASGQFSWTPSVAPATNQISVVVTDNGTPNLSATQTFSVIVDLPPALNVVHSGGQLQLSWSQGVLQEADNVTGPFLDVTNAVSPYGISTSGSHKFYRIRF